MPRHTSDPRTIRATQGDGAPLNDLDKRTVECLTCRWLTRLPWSVDAEGARHLAEGLAELHAAYQHPDQPVVRFECVHLGAPAFLEVRGAAHAHP